MSEATKFQTTERPRTTTKRYGAEQTGDILVELLKSVALSVMLSVGVWLIAYAAGTPGPHILEAAIGGGLIGTYVPLSRSQR